MNTWKSEGRESCQTAASMNRPEERHDYRGEASPQQADTGLYSTFVTERHVTHVIKKAQAAQAGPFGFQRDRLPDPLSYYEAEGLKLRGPRSARWRTTACQFHGGSDSMRINMASGAFRCMNCNAKGGDVVAYHMAMHGLDFIVAAQALGAWIDDGKLHPRLKPTALSSRAALEVLAFETTVVAVAAGNLAHGKEITESDRARLFVCVSRINRIAEDFA